MQAEDTLFAIHEDIYGISLREKQLEWRQAKGSQCQVCEKLLMNGSTLCQEHHCQVLGMKRSLGLEREAAITLLQEEYAD